MCSSLLASLRAPQEPLAPRVHQVAGAHLEPMAMTGKLVQMAMMAILAEMVFLAPLD